MSEVIGNTSPIQYLHQPFDELRAPLELLHILRTLAAGRGSLLGGYPRDRLMALYDLADPAVPLPPQLVVDSSLMEVEKCLPRLLSKYRVRSSMPLV